MTNGEGVGEERGLVGGGVSRGWHHVTLYTPCLHLTMQCPAVR